MAAQISSNLRSIIEDVQPERVSVLIEATPGEETAVQESLEEQGLDYRKATVGRMTVFETVATPAEVNTAAQTRGIERIDHNPTFSTQGACVEGAESGVTPDAVDRINRVDLREVTDQMEVPAAWDESGTRGEGVSIGMVDTAISQDHPVFEDADIVTNNQPESGEDHGTWVAGAMVGGEMSTGDGRGHVRGVAPDATLYSDGALSGGKADFIDVANGTGWALDQGVDIMNLSLGGSHSPVMQSMVAELESQGVRIVSSAGNTGPVRGSVTCPAHHNETIAVASVDTDGNVAGFSARGPGWNDAPDKPDIACYGGATEGATTLTETILGPTADGGFSPLVGTSMAAPLVAGTMALQLARDNE